MADKKISALTGATTPLAGTEVLPIVQSGTTVKVTVADLTAGRSVATAGGSFTDNITQSTSAKGINYTANTPKAGMTSQLLNWYEEGTWTPTVSGAAITVNSATYTRIGRTVSLAFDITWPATADTTNITVASFPFSAIANSGCLVLGYTDSATNRPNGAASGTGIVFFGKTGSPSTQITNADMSGKRVIASLNYFTS